MLSTSRQLLSPKEGGRVEFYRTSAPLRDKGHNPMEELAESLGQVHRLTLPLTALTVMGTMR